MPVTRIEWARLDGDEAETVLSMLLYSEHDQAVRVRPASGDGGVDVVVPNPAEGSLVDVYQIKKFAANLTAGQKGQIDWSYRRLLAQIGLRKLNVATWYLLLPLDPRPENRTWFSGLPARTIKHFEKVLAKPADYPKKTMTIDALDRIKAWQKTHGGSLSGRVSSPATLSLRPTLVWPTTTFMAAGRRSSLRSGMWPRYFVPTGMFASERL